MIICIDIGNTTITSGFYKDNKLFNIFKMATNEFLTSDEYGIKFLEILKYNNFSIESIEGIIISSVAPKVDFVIKEMCLNYFKVTPITIGPGLKTGIHIKITNPKQLGADLLVASVASVYKYNPNCLVIDMGTAITISYINEKKEFIGCSIIPGLRTSLYGLVSRTSLLEQVPLDEVKDVIGNDTKSAIQSGLIYGWVCLIKGMIKKIQDSVGNCSVILTGGEASFIIEHLGDELNIIYDENLVLDGLKIIYDKNI